MIQYIKFKNFRSLTDVTFDLSGKNGIPKQLYILYGENGFGKSNFVSGFDFLIRTIHLFSMRKQINEFLDKEDFNEEKLKLIMGYFNISQMIKENKTIDSTENMSIEIGFRLSDRLGYYYIEFDNEQIVSERLDYTINQNKGCYYSIPSYGQNRINNSIFSDEYIKELELMISKYWGKYSLLSIISDSEKEYSKEYISSSYNESMKDVIDYFRSIDTSFTDSRNRRFDNYYDNNLLRNLKSGEIDRKELPILKRTSKVLNAYFTNLYKDVVEVNYKCTEANDKICYKLYIKKQLYNRMVDIDFSLESQGTKTLLNLLQPLLLATSGGIAIIDEIDNGIHDVLLKNLIKNIQRNKINGQLIFTTHNSLLIDEYDLREYIHFIDISDDYKKTIKTITDYDFRIQPGTRILSNYLHEKFARLPWSDINFNLKEFIE